MKFDPEIVLVIYFTEEVTLRAINFITSPLIQPSFIGIYLNEDNVSFDIIEETPIFSFNKIHYT